jgi:ribonuclease P protein component
MLPKEYRLKNKAAFSATYRIKNSFYKDGIVLYAGKLKADNENPTRVGFVVSKKTHKRAVRRNRLKRLMRESYRLMLKNNETGNAQNYMSLIFVGYEKAVGKNFDEIQNSIKDLIMRLK